MEIDIKAKYKPEAGDIISWKSGSSKILFVVTNNNTSGLNKLTGITLRDNRKIVNDGKSHVVIFSEVSLLTLLLKNNKTDIEENLDEILSTWDDSE